MKKISVCMTSYNGEKYIKKQIDSILSQLSKSDELIISDDSSTDDTVDIIKKIKDDRIFLLENNTFKSPVYNLENALNNANGDLIFLSDQDDIWIENKVDVMKQYLEVYDLVVSDCSIIDENEIELYNSFFYLRKTKPGFVKNLFKNSYLGCCMAFNNKILEKAVPFPSNIPMHDIWLGAVGEVFGKTYFCAEKLLKYRRHGDNVSPTTEKSRYSINQKIGFRLNILINIIKRIMR